MAPLHEETQNKEPHIKKDLWKLAIPNILSNLTVPLAGLIDTALLGHLPDMLPLAGVALGSVLFDFIYWMFGFLRMATTGLTAQAFGRNDNQEQVHTASRGLLLASVLGLILLLFASPLSHGGLFLLGGEMDVQYQAQAYFNARIWGAPVVLANFVIMGWLLGRGMGKQILLISILGNGCNMVLDYIFIYHFGWAAWGAGLATMLSQYLMAIIGFFWFIRYIKGSDCSISWGKILERSALTKLLALNRDIFVRTFLLIASFAYFTHISAALSTVILAANAILLKVISLASYFIDGLAFAVESLAGRLFGAARHQDFKMMIRSSLLYASLMAFVFAAGFNLFPQPLFGILTSQTEILSELKSYSLWLFPVMVFGSAAYIWDGVFLGISAGRRLRNCMLVSACAGFFPWAFLAGQRQSVHLLWTSLALFMLLRSITLWRSMVNKMKSEIAISE